MAPTTVRSAPAKQRLPRLLRAGDLLLEKSGGGDQQPVGRVVLVEDDGDPTICSNFIAQIRLNEGVDPAYFQLLNRALYFSGMTRLSIKQTTGIQNLDVSHYLSRWVAMPELREQVEIRKELRQMVLAERELSESVAAQRALLEERRQTLITAAVMGEMDVVSRPSAATSA